MSTFSLAALARPVTARTFASFIDCLASEAGMYRLALTRKDAAGTTVLSVVSTSVVPQLVPVLLGCTLVKGETRAVAEARRVRVLAECRAKGGPTAALAEQLTSWLTAYRADGPVDPTSELGLGWEPRRERRPSTPTTTASKAAALANADSVIDSMFS